MLTIELHLSDGDSLILPAKYIVCPRCSGKGTHTNPSIDGNGLTREDFDEAGPEFMEDYMSGVYDVTCHTCTGTRVILDVDLDRLTHAQMQAWTKHLDDEDYRSRERDSELRWGY